MNSRGIHNIFDVKAFFKAFNEKKWDEVFQFMHHNCIWDASEKRLHGKQELIEYWTNYHSSFKETLGTPENIILCEGKVYLQVNIHLEFLEEGSFLGQEFKKGETFDFRCTDFYELDEDGMIISGQVYVMPQPRTKSA